MRRWRLFLTNFVLILILTPFLTQSQLPPGDQMARIHAFTRPLEFDYTSWLWHAWETKIAFGTMGAERRVDPATDRQIVLDYLDLMGDINRNEARLRDALADPNGVDEAKVNALREQLAKDYDRRTWLAPLAEQVLQAQISAVLAENGLGLGGQPMPPVLYRTTPVPMALIVSPRTEIRQIANISLEPNLTLEQQIRLEDEVAQALDVSTLVVPIGGVGVYPTMVMQTDNLPWLVETIAHEWTHNYLDWHPLGLHYDTSPALRTMNETTASIVGKEIGRMVLEQYYPDKVPPPPPPPSTQTQNNTQNNPPAFDFRAEMRKTRVHVDELLAEGKVEEAEAYMEQRRRFFWEHGYHIRKLNQAYFAFYGAYAASPGGAAGEDPVGAAVRQLRAESPSVAAFLKRIAWMSSYEDLQKALGEKK
ncbi:MAG: hypothetical protein GXO56_00780 [Chloroflexi bacterium]|nr:hypothetical protein [Chloroflexota bacterium]